MANLHFLNAFHNGDIFVSRNYVKWLIETIKPDNVFYYHDNSEEVLKDIENIKTLPFSQCKLPQSTEWIAKDDNYFINTWYNGCNGRYFGCTTIKTLHNLFQSEIQKMFNIRIEDSYDNFLPSIDFNKINKEQIDVRLNNLGFSKKILISNGETLSGQSFEVNFEELITNLSNKHQDALILYTNNLKYPISAPNIISTRDIIQKKGSDLLENSYISTLCDVIIHRSSGVGTYSYLKENFTRNCKMLGISYAKIIIDFGLNDYWNKNIVWVNTNNYNECMNNLHI